MINRSVTQTIIVQESQTASHLGSGMLPVFSTPAMIALMENTAMKAISDVSEKKTSVGTAISTSHLKASKVGAQIHCKATITSIEGRKYTFNIIASDEKGDLIGEGTHERVLVDIEKFMSKLQ